MGKLLIVFNYVFLLFSSDINEKRRHIHVTDTPKGNKRLCKFWLEPQIEMAYNLGFSEPELNKIKSLIVENKDIIDAQIDKFLSGQAVKSIKK